MLGLLRAAPWRALVVVSLAGLVSACEGAAGPAGTKGASGTPCSVVDNKDGTKTVTCGTTTVQLTDGTAGKDGAGGKAGADGAAGKDGVAGKDGAAGKDGTSCTATKAAGVVTISCTDGTSATVADGKDGAAGKDGSSCTAAKDAATGTVTVTCADGTSATIDQGAAGKDGKDGVDGATGATGTTGDTGATGKDGSSCTAKDNGDGSKTISCTDGTKVTVKDGLPAPNGIAIQVKNFHGIDLLMSTGNYLNGAKKLVQATITSATADVDGLVTVSFKLMDGTKPIIGFTSVTAAGKSSLSANIVKLIPASETGEVFTKWVPYIYAKDTVANTAKYQWPVGKDGDVSYKASSEKAAFATTAGGKLTDNGDGTYTYVFLTNLKTVTIDGTTLVGYDRSLTHRVALMIGGSVGPTADAWFDFVPDGSKAATPRDVVRTEACYQCHGETQFKGHGGNRLHVQVCVTCHNPATVEPRGGAAIDFKTLIHKIHAGAELQSAAGADGVVWDDPATAANEAADNGKVGNFGRYQFGIYSSSGSITSWWDVGFPAVIDNCVKCHDAKFGAAQADNWKTVPSRAACGSCHDLVDYSTGAGHGPNNKGGKQLTDKNCGGCHDDGVAPSPETAHKWYETDARNTQEFKVDLTVSKPGNGQYFVAGESPVVTLKLTGVDDNKAVDWTSMAEDDTQTGEGCYSTGCAARDGKLASSSLFVSGPRALRMPVLTTNAHAEIVSASAGPFDLSLASTNTVAFTIDGGLDVTAKDAFGQDFVKPGFIAVSGKPATGKPAFFASSKAATADEVVAWLNGDANFKARAIALKTPAGKVVVRSRNLGKVYTVQVANQLYTSNIGPLTTAIFGSDVNVHGLTGLNPGTAVNGYVPGLSTVANTLAKRTKAGALDDPKVKWYSDHVDYTLDPVDDLTPGTYTAKVEITDAGVAPATTAENACVAACAGNWVCKAACGNYKTPSVALVNFQVGQVLDAKGVALTEEPFIARNCSGCHTAKDAAGVEHGFVVDYQRHNKLLSDNATDLCGNCHDYLPQNPFLNIGGATEFGWSGAKPISRRVHAVHNGANLTSPIATVGHSETTPGRNWDIGFPQDIRNCEVCHTAATSGTWATNPNRIACGGCHDDSFAQGHFKAMTYDPSPVNPYSGDEVESCATCH